MWNAFDNQWLEQMDNSMRLVCLAPSVQFKWPAANPRNRCALWLPRLRIKSGLYRLPEPMVHFPAEILDAPKAHLDVQPILNSMGDILLCVLRIPMICIYIYIYTPYVYAYIYIYMYICMYICSSYEYLPPRAARLKAQAYGQFS